jgi:hypothetical protein
MKKLITIISVTIYLSAGFIYATPILFNSGTVTKKEEEPSEQVGGSPYRKEFKTVDEIINEVAPLFNQDPKLISKISFCESSHKIQSHDGGKGFNVTGIHNITFNYWLKQYQKEINENLNINSTYDQIKVMSWAFSKGDRYRNQWTTYVALKNGGTYTFYSKMLGKNFTARCK